MSPTKDPSSNKEKPQILQRQAIANSPFFSVEQVGLKFSNGEQRDYQKLKSLGHGAVMVIPVLNNDTLLMIREYGGGIDDYHLSFPKGAVDRGESLAEAANRELMEEVGYGAKRLIPLREVFLSPGYMEHSIHIFLGLDLYEAKLEGDEPEPIEVIHHPLVDADALLERNDFIEGRAIAGLFLAQRYLQQNS